MNTTHVGSVLGEGLGSLVLYFALLLSANVAVAQCGNQWLQSTGIVDIRGWASDAIEWDPDGSGPRPALLVVCGGFSFAGTAQTYNIAAFDFVSGTWQPLGNGVGGACYSLAVLPGGDLVAAGAFTWAGSVTANHIARWDGSTWSAFGTGPDAPVFDVTVLPQRNPNGARHADVDRTGASRAGCRAIARSDASE